MWKKIRGVKFYRVSDSGKIKSLPRFIKYDCPHKEGTACGCNKGRWVPGKILKQSTVNGYRTVNLGSRHRNKSVHRLVAEAFIPNPHNLPEVNHKDLNKANNRVGNLEWTTYEGNRDHAKRSGVKFGRPKKVRVM